MSDDNQAKILFSFGAGFSTDEKKRLIEAITKEIKDQSNVRLSVKTEPPSDAAMHGAPLDLNSDEVDLINELVEPFVKTQWKNCNPACCGIIERGVVISLLDKERKLHRIQVKILDPKED